MFYMDFIYEMVIIGHYVTWALIMFLAVIFSIKTGVNIVLVIETVNK